MSMEADESLQDYDSIIRSAESRVFHLLHSVEWQLQSENIKATVWKMKCNITDSSMFRYGGTIKGREPAEVAAMIHPEGIHRAQWDKQSAGTSLVSKINDETCIIRHVTKPRLLGLVAARDSIDLCHFSTDPVDGTRSVVMVSVVHPSSPVVGGIVRAQTHPTLLLLQPSGSDTKITSIVHADIFLTGVPISIKDSLVPKGIHSFFDDLQSYARKENKINLNHRVTGWI